MRDPQQQFTVSEEPGKVPTEVMVLSPWAHCLSHTGKPKSEATSVLRIKVFICETARQEDQREGSDLSLQYG